MREEQVSVVAMEIATNVKLFGSWASSYTHRVQLALKLKGIEFEYIEEDLAKKSPNLLLHNPIYKKVPLLLHRGRPLAESIIILHYLDDTWPETHPLLPKDPFDRALARFWCHFIDNKLGPAVRAVFTTCGEEQKAAAAGVHENLKIVEVSSERGLSRGGGSLEVIRLGCWILFLGAGPIWLSVFEEVAAVRLFDPEEFPLFHAWLKEFEEQEEVKEIIPGGGKLLEYARGVREMLMLSLKGDEAAESAGSHSNSGDSSNISS